MSQLIQLSFKKIMQTRAYTVIVLNAQEKSFAIYTDSSTGRILQTLLTETPTPRPLTHSVANLLFEGMDYEVKQVIINDVQDTIYFTRLFLEKQNDELRHIIEIDARPSDSLVWALMGNAPVYCTQEVLDKTIQIELVD